MLRLQVNNDYKQFVTVEDLESLRCELHDVKTELNYQLTEVTKVPTSDTSVQCNSLETSHLYVDVANINTLINPQLRQLEFEVSKLKDKILAIENKRQKEAEKDMVYIMGE